MPRQQKRKGEEVVSATAASVVELGQEGQRIEGSELEVYEEFIQTMDLEQFGAFKIARAGKTNLIKVESQNEDYDVLGGNQSTTTVQVQDNNDGQQLAKKEIFGESSKKLKLEIKEERSSEVHEQEGSGQSQVNFQDTVGINGEPQAAPVVVVVQKDQQPQESLNVNDKSARLNEKIKESLDLRDSYFELFPELSRARAQYTLPQPGPLSQYFQSDSDSDD